MGDYFLILCSYLSRLDVEGEIVDAVVVEKTKARATFTKEVAKGNLWLLDF
jgi:hypothetical protein